MNRKAFVVLLAGLLAAASLSSAGRESVLKVGATAVPHAEILKVVQPDLAAQGIKLEIIEFTDYVTPNIALAEKQLDANFFQHLPYLQAFAGERKLSLESVVAVHVEPLGLYSKKYRKAADFPAGSTIAIPNDPTNEGRALIFLQSKGLIKLRANAGLQATTRDIAENPKKFQFKEIEAPQLPRTPRGRGRLHHQWQLRPAGRLQPHEGRDSPRGRRLPLRQHPGGAQGANRRTRASRPWPRRSPRQK